MRSVGARISFDQDNQPQFEVPPRDDTFNTADIHPPSRSRRLSDLRREALALARTGVIVGDAVVRANYAVARALGLPTGASGAGGGNSSDIPGAGPNLPGNAEKLLGDAQLRSVAACLPPTAINVAAYRLCMRSRPGAAAGHPVAGAARAAAVLAGGGGAHNIAGNAGVAVFNEEDIAPFRFSATRLTGVPDELAPPRANSTSVSSPPKANSSSGINSNSQVSGTGIVVSNPWNEGGGSRGGGGGGAGRARGGGRYSTAGGGPLETPPGDDGDEDYVDGEETSHGAGAGGRGGGRGGGKRGGGVPPGGTAGRMSKGTSRRGGGRGRKPIGVVSEDVYFVVILNRVPSHNLSNMLFILLSLFLFY